MTVLNIILWFVSFSFYFAYMSVYLSFKNSEEKNDLKNCQEVDYQSHDMS